MKAIPWEVNIFEVGRLIGRISTSSKSKAFEIERRFNREFQYKSRFYCRADDPDLSF